MTKGATKLQGRPTLTRALHKSGRKIYAIVGVAPPGTDLIYFAFVNYTTLGYGDVTPLQRWHLLGPMTAMNGVLLFGWSTAVIFAVLQKALMTSLEDGLQRSGASSE
jgi:Ion channel